MWGAGEGCGARLPHAARPVVLLVVGLGLGLGLGPLVLGHVQKHVPVHDPQDEKQPVQVDELQREDQREHDRLRDPALVLLRGKVERVRPDGPELGEHRPQNPEVEPVSEVDPHGHKHEEERPHEHRVQVVERLGRGQEEVGDVHRDVHGNAHPREVEPVRQADQQHRDDVVEHELLEVLARLLQLQDQHHALLRPERRLRQVVELEQVEVGDVRVLLVERPRVEVPHRRLLHHVQPQRAAHAVVAHRVRLLREPSNLGLLADAKVQRKRPQHNLHEELSVEREEHHHVRDKRKVLPALLVQRRVGVRNLVRHGHKHVQRVRRSVVVGKPVRQLRRGQKHQRRQPRVSVAEDLDRDPDLAEHGKIVAGVCGSVELLFVQLGRRLDVLIRVHGAQGRHRVVSEIDLAHRRVPTSACSVFHKQRITKGLNVANVFSAADGCTGVEIM
ncbi:hypothetical protein KL948_002864 [Ogataea haglerorum]|nr:hypothetical protein KL948_002864 [Ogataea haglerorum]